MGLTSSHPTRASILSIKYPFCFQRGPADGLRILCVFCVLRLNYNKAGTFMKHGKGP